MIADDMTMGSFKLVSPEYAGFNARGLIQLKDAIFNLTSIGIPIIKIRQSYDCLIFIIVIQAHVSPISSFSCHSSLTH